MATENKGFSDKAKAVYKVVKAAEETGSPVTAKDIAEQTGLTMRSVTGVITGAFKNKGYMERVEKKVKVGDEAQTVKFITLTDTGRALDIDA